MIELGKKTIINKGIGYQWTLLKILEFLEDSHVNVLYAYNSLNKTPLAYISKCKTIPIDLINYKETISENIFRIDYVFIETDSGIEVIDKWLSELDINTVYITNEDSFYHLANNINFTNQYSLYTKSRISLYASPDKLENYIIKDCLLGNEYSLKDLMTLMIRDKKIKDLGID
jgi:hypothetical protein